MLALKSGAFVFTGLDPQATINAELYQDVLSTSSRLNAEILAVPPSYFITAY